MNINRHNYEEYFLLYIDNELTPTQRKEVEDFVDMHADLKEEFAVMQQLTLTADEIHFEHKSDLLQHKAERINLANCQTFFLSYIDDELNESDKAATEKFILQHPDVQPSFDSLKKAVLPNEAIVCPDKERLYKKETKVAPIFWFRMMAAAVVIGLGIMLWVLIPGDKPLTSGAGLAYQSNESANNQSPTTDVNVVDASNNNTIQAAAEETTVRNTNMQVYNAAQTSGSNTSTGNKTNVSISPAVVIDIPVTNQPKTITPDKKPDIVTIPKPDKSDKIEPKENTNFYTAASPDEDNTTTIQPAVLRTLDTEDEEKNMVYIGSAQISKQKLRGLFKTVTKMFEKPGKNKQHNTDDNSVEGDKK